MGALDLTLGCMFIGVTLNVFLYGMSCVQTFFYYAHFKHDSKFLRSLVGFLFIADTLNSVLNIHFIYYYLVTKFGDFQAAGISNPTFAADPVMTGIIAFTCQLFFAWRVYRLMHNVWMPTIITVFSIASLAGAIGSTIEVTIVQNFAEFQKFQSLVSIWLAGAVAADSCITAALVYTLRKSRTGFAGTDDIVSRLVRSTIQTGLLTSTFAAIDLVLFLASTSTLHLVFNLPLAKLYVNTLLSTLNARAYMSMHSNSYTMEGSHSEANQQGSGRVGSSFRPSASKSRGSIQAGGAKLNVFKPGMSQISQFSQQGDVENGIHIMTVEERFEERDGQGRGGLGEVQHLPIHTLKRQQSDMDFHSTHENEKERISDGESTGDTSGTTAV